MGTRFGILFAGCERNAIPITEKVTFITAARSLENQGLQMRALGALLHDEPVVVIATIDEATQRILRQKN